MKRIFAALAVLGLAVGGVQKATAGGFSINVGAYAPPVCLPPVVYAAPPPVYMAPAPVVVCPRPVYVAPAPVYVAPPVLRFGFGFNFGHYHHHPHGGW